jgi:hypothetical protein
MFAEFSEFSDMEWLQIVVLHTEEHTAMLVDDQMCVIGGQRKLATKTITNFDNEHLSELLNLFILSFKVLISNVKIKNGNNSAMKVNKFLLICLL